MIRTRLSCGIGVAALAVSACAPHWGSLRERAAAEGTCNDARAQYLIDRQATVEAGQEALRATGARIFEWIAPGMIVTVAFSPWRVRVTYDERMTITEIRCG